jgi:hypothetical protein
MLLSIEEHQENPKEDAAVMPVGGPRKRLRVCNLTSERRQRMRERTRGNSGFRRKTAAVCRKVPAVQKWHGEKETSSEKFRPWKSVDDERSSPPE